MSWFPAGSLDSIIQVIKIRVYVLVWLFSKKITHTVHLCMCWKRIHDNFIFILSYHINFRFLNVLYTSHHMLIENDLNKWIFWCQSQQVQNSITVFEDIFIWLKKVCIYWKSIYMFLELLEVSHYYIYFNATEKSIYFWEFFKNHISMNFT